MTYRVVNTLSGEIVCETGNEDQAVTLAVGLAEKADHSEQFAVEKIVVVYETPPVKSEPK